MNWQPIQAILCGRRTLLALYVLAAVFTSVQLIALGPHPFVMPRPGTIPSDIMNQPQYMALYTGRHLTEYNNYVIFKYSWFHLLHGNNLYGIYPAEHWDFYKYSPTFGLFMGSLAYLPDIIGLSFWNLLNALALFLAINMLPFTPRRQALLLWFAGNELLTCLSNTQSNALMCALIIGAFACMERGRMWWAALWLVAATYIKVYGAIGCCLFVFYPGKLRFTLAILVWAVVFAVLPLLITPLPTLLWQYHNWAALMLADAAAATGLSVNGWLGSWFGITGAGRAVTITGLLLFLIPFTRLRLYGHLVFRQLTLACMLIWVIIFNHKAESATYIIAVTGVGIWYFASPKAKWRTILLFFVLIFTSLSTTDFFPLYVRTHFIQPYAIKAVPCIVVWAAAFIALLTMRPQLPPAKENKIPAGN